MRGTIAHCTHLPWGRVRLQKEHGRSAQGPAPTAVGSWTALRWGLDQERWCSQGALRGSSCPAGWRSAPAKSRWSAWPSGQTQCCRGHHEGLGQRKCPEWRVGILRAGPLPCSRGQPVGLEVPPPGLVSARQPVWGSWHSTLPVLTPQVSLGGTAGCKGSWFL